METRSPGGNDCVRGDLSICVVAFSRAVYVDARDTCLPQVRERRGGMQALDGAAR
jgi:hypothetical protein